MSRRQDRPSKPKPKAEKAPPPKASETKEQKRARIIKAFQDAFAYEDR